MNGSAQSHQASALQMADGANGAEADFLSRIHEALAAVHSPYSSNEARKEASIFLESIKNDDAAPFHGFTLAKDRSQDAVVRHYALSLLEHAIRHRWPEDGSENAKEQEVMMRGWVLQLSEKISSEDPAYLRNKTAQLWVEVAKRSWGAEWTDMDDLLVEMWEVPGSIVHKEFVLFVLETLSDEIFHGDDPIAAMREGALSGACVEIFTPVATLIEYFPNRQTDSGGRHGEEGWLIRVGQLIEQCLDTNAYNSEQYRSCATKALGVFRSAMPWAIPNGIADAGCVKHMRQALGVSSVPVQMASIEALYSLYARTHFSDKEFLALVCPMYTSESVDLLRKLYEWSIVTPQDIDEEKYMLSKKFSEMMSLLGNFIELKVSAIPEDCDLTSLLNLFLSIVRNQSLVVSIPILSTWTHLLRSETISVSPTVAHLIAPLLEICSSRLVRYESLPEDSQDPCLLLLVEDIDTIPERHAFIGNYRRYCTMIVELIVRRQQSDAVYHILSQVGRSLETLYEGQAPFSMETYSKLSMPILQVDAQFTVVEAALKGYMKWRMAHGKKPQQDEQQRNKMEGDLEAWCERLLEMNFEDPIIRKRILQLAVAFSTSALDTKSSFMLKVLEHLLMTDCVERPEYPEYSDAVKERHNDAMHELSRLAVKMPDQLLEVFDQLEAKVNQIVASRVLDSKQQVAYQTFLFTIVLRASGIDPTLRMQRLSAYIAPIKQLWQNPEMDVAVSTFEQFCDLLGLSKVRDYMISHRVHEVSDWATLKLDEEGQAIQTELNDRVKALPLRPTKAFVASSTEKIDKDSVTHKTACALWTDLIPLILPNLLKFLSHAHAFHNPANWSGLPPEMQPVVSRILTDRFWQAGISGGSKDEFYARVTGTRSTMEGLASSIRGSVRTVREICYAIMFGLSRFDVNFYGFKELPGPLAHALFADAHCLSSHQLINLITLVRYLVDDCPVEIRSHFIPPILATCFTQIDGKISSEWEKLANTELTSSDDDTLAVEMKEESILRQLTHSAALMVATLFDPARSNPTAGPSTAKDASTYRPEENGSTTWPTMRQFCLSSMPILEALLLFSTHAIRMRDTRCCGVILRVFRSIIPEFAAKGDGDSRSNADVIDSSNDSGAPIREFISSEVLKACITSLHEPYFVDLQKELAQLIATILTYYCRLTPTPRQVLLSLPGLTEKAVDKCIGYVCRVGAQQKQQRAQVLDLLRDLKGVSISEQGRITKDAATIRKMSWLGDMMERDFVKTGEVTNRGTTPNLEGIAGMFET